MKIGVLGAGSMGTGIAQVAATFGHSVVLFDSNIKAVEKAISEMEKSLSKLVEKGKMSLSDKDALLSRIITSNKIEDYAGAELIIEAIIENLDVKKSVFSKMESIVSDDCILASNTSSLSIASIAAACQKPERVIGIHFFNPAPLMKLVEIIPAVQTSEATLQKSKSIIDSWQKITVITKDTPGFIVNRVARPFYGEALRIFEEGIANIATIDWAMTEIGGFRMGPFTLMDYIGNDINYTVTETVFSSFYYDPRYKPAFTQKRLAEAGYLGRKTGRGHYNYTEGASNPVADKNEELGNKIFNRILVMLINEAADALFWNIASKEDIDLAMTNGVNYPKGLLKWADEIGIQNCVNQLDELYNEYHEDRYRCSALLRRMGREDKMFYHNS
jgi:3-hydroxybutyryl-CoA dehydrogenase